MCLRTATSQDRCVYLNTRIIHRNHRGVSYTIYTYYWMNDILLDTVWCAYGGGRRTFTPSFTTSLRASNQRVSLCKILFHFKAVLSESIILLPPSPPAKPTLLQYLCTAIPQYTPPHRTLPSYAIHHTILVMAISCKGQPKGSLTQYTHTIECTIVY